MPATKRKPADETLVTVESISEQLAEGGRTDLAEQWRVFASTIERDTVSTTEAAKLAGVSHQTIKNWIGRGILVATQAAPNSPHRIDRASLAHTIERRTAVSAARAAFATPEAAVEFLSGLDKETIERLGGM
jgi:hypothetical protein